MHARTNAETAMSPDTSVLALAKLLPILLIAAVANASFAAENQWFTIDVPDDWSLSTSADIVSVIDTSGQVRFKVNVNLENNDFPMCFCAPWEKYQLLTIDGHDAARLQQDNHLTLKVRGVKHSTDVHYTFSDEKVDRENIKAIESIRPK